jgi:hypothetical protein
LGKRGMGSTNTYRVTAFLVSKVTTPRYLKIE